MGWTRAALTTNLIVAGALVLALAAPLRGDVPVEHRYDGIWAYADGARGQHRIEAAVRQAVAGLPFFIEPFATEQLRAMTGPFRRITFNLSDRDLTFRADHWGPVTARLNGTPASIQGPEGSRLSLRQFFDHGRLVQVFSHPDGSRRNVFALSGDGQWLWMSVRIVSPRLPNDCTYRLRYRRVARR